MNQEKFYQMILFDTFRVLAYLVRGYFKCVMVVSTYMFILQLVCYKSKILITGPILVQSEKYISMESGGYADHDISVCACAHTYANMPVCMHTFFWCAWAHISAQLGRIRKIDISME